MDYEVGLHNYDNDCGKLEHDYKNVENPNQSQQQNCNDDNGDSEGDSDDDDEDNNDDNNNTIEKGRLDEEDFNKECDEDDC